MQLNKTSYNKIAVEWAATRDQSFVSKLITKFAQVLPVNASVLEIGCGNGFLSNYLADLGFEVTGIDFSENMIQLAKEKGTANTKFITSDFFDYETTAIYDGILAWDTFFHFSYAKQESIYPKLAQLIKPGGYLLFTHADADDTHIDQMMGEPFYYSCLPKEKVLDILQSLDFDIVYCQTNYVEQNMDRNLIILARKKENLIDK